MGLIDYQRSVSDHLWTSRKYIKRFLAYNTGKLFENTLYALFSETMIGRGGSQMDRTNAESASHIVLQKFVDVIY